MKIDGTRERLIHEHVVRHEMAQKQNQQEPGGGKIRVIHPDTPKKEKEGKKEGG